MPNQICVGTLCIILFIASSPLILFAGGSTRLTNKLSAGFTNSATPSVIICWRERRCCSQRHAMPFAEVLRRLNQSSWLRRVIYSPDISEPTHPKIRPRDYRHWSQLRTEFREEHLWLMGTSPTTVRRGTHNPMSNSLMPRQTCQARASKFADRACHRNGSRLLSWIGRHMRLRKYLPLLLRQIEEVSTTRRKRRAGRNGGSRLALQVMPTTGLRAHRYCRDCSKLATRNTGKRVKPLVMLTLVGRKKQ